jgi:Family of unknown function (DUF6390)
VQAWPAPERVLTDATGALLFARYAYPPNALGLCGADEPRTLLEYGDAREADGGLAQLARTFEGAWPYLELIAHANGIEDPLDLRVVQAYWVGNELLGRVGGADLARHVDERFRGRLGRSGEAVTAAIAGGVTPHHCFHVFAVYPWLGLLRSGIVDEPLRVLDRCRTTPATVLGVDGDHAAVLTRSLVWDGERLTLAAPALREVEWRRDGLAFVRPPVAGDVVALHWDFVCDVLAPREARMLEAVTAQVLRAVNGSPTAAALV